MAIGPGKYDDMCTYVREQVGLDGGAVVLIVVGGNLGPGFSIQGDLETMEKLPALLEGVARKIRQDRGLRSER